MSAREHLEYIRALARKDGRYEPEAFLFVSEAISCTVNWVKKGVIKPAGEDEDRGNDGEFHVSGQELLAGISKLAQERWGRMAKVVLNSWGVKRTEDFGEIVFCMVEDEHLAWNRRECDRREDFAGGYNFDEEFGCL